MSDNDLRHLYFLKKISFNGPVNRVILLLEMWRGWLNGIEISCSELHTDFLGIFVFNIFLHITNKSARFWKADILFPFCSLWPVLSRINLTENDKISQLRNILNCNNCVHRGDHLSGKPVNGREVDSCQGNIRILTVRETMVDCSRIKNFTMHTGWLKKVSCLIVSKYVNKTENLGGMWTNTNSYSENEALSDIFTWNILHHSGFMFKYSVTESNQWH